MDVVAIDPSISSYQTTPKLKLPLFRLPSRTPPRVLHCTPLRFSHKIVLTNFHDSRFNSVVQKDRGLRSVWVKSSSSLGNPSTLDSNFVEILVKKGLILGAVCCVLGCRGVLAAEGVLNGGNFVGLEQQVKGSMVNYMPKVLMVLKVLKEQGLILAALFGLSAFFSMAETSITTLWPWKVRELAEKESENGVFKMLRNDVTRFLTTILIGTTVVNIGATALVTEAATAIFGEAGVSAATGVMTVAVLLLTEITPKSIAVHNATEVARVVVRPIAWLSLVLYPVGRVVTYLSMGMLKLLGLKGRSEPYVTEDELKLMLRGAELSGAIEEEEQDMIENVLEIKDTYVREVMTPLVDVVASDSSATLIDFHTLWVTHQYSRVPVFEQRVDNIVGIAYAMDLLDYVQKGDLLESTTVGDMAHKPAYFVPDSMSVWNLLREFRIRKVHMAVVLNEYGGTVGIVTLEDVVEEIVGEIFDENDSKEIDKKTGYIVMRAEGIYDVDANTSIDQLSEDLNIKMPEGHQYETVSGFVCEAFGYIPKTGESIKVVLEKEEVDDEYIEDDGDRQHQKEKEKNQVFQIEILAGNARKVGAVRFERVTNEEETEEKKVVVPVITKRKWGGDDDDETDIIDEDDDVIPQHEIKEGE
ncbi:putative CBS domain, CNNM, transmembrane domain, Transporter-associated domain-containing protein [Helianthus annuus]|nr:putative CBS domain, CNNM, transmembrane domain, Transporter-associated domain-containing protein [Helianthus annuus]KAJ0874352.1 putative gliding motility-associated protein GldE [Helianthus annuus]